MKFHVPFTFEADDEEDALLIAKGLRQFAKENSIKAQVGDVTDLVAAHPDLTVVYTDGGCDMKKGGLGGWAYVVVHPDGSVTEKCGGEFETTNNRMEMTAVIRALEELEIGRPIKVVSDSEYIIKGCTQWSRNWVRNGWKTAAGGAVINRDLWEVLLALYQLHAVTFEWVKGHNGVEMNERCDVLCTEVMTNMHKEALMGAASGAG